MEIIRILAAECGIAAWQAENAVKLIDEDNTIPFIARYRKELTGSLDDQVLRALHERLLYLRGLAERREQVVRSIEEQGLMTDEIYAAIYAASTLAEIEDIYRPFKPKRRTRATIAAERGLAPLADIIFAQELETDAEAAAMPFINAELEVPTAADAIAGACDIIAERIADEPEYRSLIRALMNGEGFVVAKGAKDAEGDDEAAVYEMYFDFNEPVSKIAGHRVLAVNRGEKENRLKVCVEPPDEKIISELQNRIVYENRFTKQIMADTVADSYKRLIAPSIEREIRNALTEKSEEGAIRVFAENLRQLLLSPPVRGKTVLALDPGYRTGCKTAVVDETGRVLETGVIYCTIVKDTEPSKQTMLKWIKKHRVNLIAIGNGTASRETEAVVAEMLREHDLRVPYAIVNEAGASVYSASKLGAEEFPEFDVALRSAVSIGRRLQDPLAELVKIDPKSIGVGQYQHDMNQKRLGDTLGGVVEDCVNAVGVDLNTASVSLLSYVAGVTGGAAKNIIAYREENGRFKNRDELLKVKKLGPKAFKQCAGFLRIPGGDNPLDNTGVHPESYEAAEKILPLINNEGIDSLSGKAAEKFAKQLSIGVPTLTDIVKELQRPGRDPRDELPPPLLRSDVLEMEDLTEGMILKGTVRNIVDFGVFVDIGVHQDGLVHLSQIADKFIKHPLDAVKVGEVVSVKVLAVDLKRKRISLSMKGLQS
ncbi:MAG: RNA-binding transcriptional accessory protein [Defluviitaleaceae bacterium]|nr:RNA-binding transcriptional accessory protein [Defluviitaleaceae bacterium]